MAPKCFSGCLTKTLKNMLSDMGKCGGALLPEKAPMPSGFTPRKDV